MVCNVDFIVITGNILRSVNDNSIVKPGISLYRRSLKQGSTVYFVDSQFIDGVRVATVLENP